MDKMPKDSYYDMNLYFVALVPESGIRDRVRKLKEEMSDKYEAKHALKSPAHITLQMPFKRPQQDEEAIINELKKFASLQEPFRVDFSGFGSFAPRVIFIKVIEPSSIIRIHAGLKIILTGKLEFNAGDLMQTVQPHMTIATRDLTKEMYHLAWPHFEDRGFEASFDVKSLFLLKHNGRNWDIFREFNFRSDEQA